MRIIERNMQDGRQCLAWWWWPFNLDVSPKHAQGWLRLPGWWFVSFGLELEPDERLVTQFGPIRLTRPETREEREEREECETEERFLEREANRYTEWYY